MSSARPENADALLAEVLAGRLDALSPEQVERLEAHLQAEPAAEAALAAARPPAATLPDEPMPSAEAWDALWARIDQTAATPGAGQLRRVRAVWRAVVAAAACGLAMLAWKQAASPAVGPVVLAHDVTIESLEVGRGESAFVVYLDEGSGPPVVWVLSDSANGVGPVR